MPRSKVAVWMTVATEDREYLHQLAATQGVTVSVLVRDAVNAYLKGESLRTLEPIGGRGRPTAYEKVS